MQFMATVQVFIVKWKKGTVGYMWHREDGLLVSLDM